MSPPRILSPLLLVLATTPAVAAWQEPDRRETETLVAEYLARDGRSPEGVRRQDEILARLSLLPPLDARGVRDWRKKIDKLWAKGPKLLKKSGTHHLWEKEERGLYIVGGNSGGRPKGLFIGLHGGGQGSGEASSSRDSYDDGVKSARWVAIYPEVLEKTEHGWTDSGTEEFVLELIERACRTWKIDRDHVYLGGHSMGGYGTWTLGARHADLFAALTPSAGGPTPYLNAAGEPDGIVEGVIPNLRNVPMVIYQSDNDPRVPAEVNRVAVQELAAASETWGGYEHEYWEVPGRGHDLPPGGWKALMAKVKDRVRDPYPERLVWQPTRPWKRQFYWLWWDRPVSRAIVVADRDPQANTITLRSGGPTPLNPKGLAVLLSDELLDLEREVVVMLEDQEVFRGRVERTLAALVATGRHGDPRLTFDVRLTVGR